MNYRTVKGMKDLLPGEIERWHRLERAFRRTVELHGYQEVRTPSLEHTELFVRSIGETTDVVGKEMFTLEREDGQGGRESLTLRPEGTAGAARAYLNHSVHAKEPLTRWYYVGPMFRAESPQRGRYRQFHQAGCELYGDPGPISDAEMIDMLARFLGETLGIPGIEVNINSIGGPEARVLYRTALLDFLRPKAASLSEHARERLEANPLRVLDSKDERDKRACEGAPSILDVLPEADLAHWKGLLATLTALGTGYVVRPNLVRGLDYYTRTLFEITSTAGDLGSQNTLLGGGRYDGMLQSLGGPSVPAIGFAMGLERILLAMPETAAEKPAFCAIAPIGARAQLEGARLARELRELGVRCDLDSRGNSMKSMLRRANSLGAPLCLVLGDSELDRGIVQLKDLAAHAQEEVPRAEVAARVAARLNSTGAAVQGSS
jgi:histidyl-tRNA synthetase